MIRCLILFIIIMVCYASTAAAQGLSGAILYQDCAALSNTTEYAVCISYLRGFTEGLFAGDHGRASGLPYCGPASMDMTQILLIAQKYMREHPEELNRAAGANMFNAFLTAFPLDTTDFSRKPPLQFCRRRIKMSPVCQLE